MKYILFCPDVNLSSYIRNGTPVTPLCHVTGCPVAELSVQQSNCMHVAQRASWPVAQRVSCPVAQWVALPYSLASQNRSGSRDYSYPGLYGSAVLLFS